MELQFDVKDNRIVDFKPLIDNSNLTTMEELPKTMNFKRLQFRNVFFE